MEKDLAMAMASPWYLSGIPPGYLGRAWSFPKPAVFADQTNGRHGRIREMKNMGLVQK